MTLTDRAVREALAIAAAMKRCPKCDASADRDCILLGRGDSLFTFAGKFKHRVTALSPAWETGT